MERKLEWTAVSSSRKDNSIPQCQWDQWGPWEAQSCVLRVSASPAEVLLAIAQLLSLGCKILISTGPCLSELHTVVLQLPPPTAGLRSLGD